MARENYTGSILDDLHARARVIQQRVIDEANKMIPDVKRDIFTEFGTYQQEEVEKLFREAVDEFYAAYSPIFYARSYSLYNALEFEPDEYGIVDDQIDDDGLFKANGVTPFERGGGSEGLFEHVFMQGWHGGASGTDHRGESVSSPHYRTPNEYYTYWGRPAYRSTSPHDLAMRKIRGAEGRMDNEFERIARQRIDIFAEDLTNRASQIVSEVLSDGR